MEYTIKGREDWQKHKHLYQAGEWRLHSNPPLSGSWFGYPDLEHYRRRYRKAVEHGKFKCLVFREPYECIREILGTDRMLELMALDPQLIREMLRHNLDITFQMLDLLDRLGLTMDGYWVWGDIAYNRGLFFSPEMYRDLLLPLHRELLARLGDYVIYHTDGLLTGCLPLLLEAGIKGINPVEIKAGNNFFRHRRPLRRAHRDHRRHRRAGHVDERQNRDRGEIRRKLLHAKRKKYIYHSDHSIPYDVTLDTYRFVIQKVKQYGACGET